MARVLADFIEPPRTCSYLPDRLASLECRVMADVSVLELDDLLVRGWRRQGPFYFRPACAACGECVSLRVPTDRFSPTASQKRARRRSRRLRAVLGRPRVDAARLDLYARWHAAREESRGWDAAPLDSGDYRTQFAFPHPAAFELSLHDGDRLVAVTLCDITPRAWSAVFCYYDPRDARTSPGVASVLIALEMARARGVPHVYLGFRVLDCPSMRYKARFRPHQLLTRRPEPTEEPEWQEAP